MDYFNITFQFKKLTAANLDFKFGFLINQISEFTFEQLDFESRTNLLILIYQVLVHFVYVCLKRDRGRALHFDLLLEEWVASLLQCNSFYIFVIKKAWNLKIIW